MRTFLDTDRKRQCLGEMQTQSSCLSTETPMHCLHAVTDEDGHPLEDENESSVKLCTFWCKIF